MATRLQPPERGPWQLGATVVGAGLGSLGLADALTGGSATAAQRALLLAVRLAHGAGPRLGLASSFLGAVLAYVRG